MSEKVIHVLCIIVVLHLFIFKNQYVWELYRNIIKHTISSCNMSYINVISFHAKYKLSINLKIHVNGKVRVNNQF